MTRTALAAVALVVLMILSFVGGIVVTGRSDLLLNPSKWFNGSPPVFTSRGPVIRELQAIGQLAVLNVSVVDVLQGEGEGRKGFWLTRGDALIAVDMTKAEIADRDDAAKTATIVVPEPIVVSPRVDHERTLTFDVQKSSWIAWMWGDQGKLRDQAMWHAQELIEHAATKDEHMALAKENCRNVLRTLFDGMDWDVEVKFVGAADARETLNTETTSDKKSTEAGATASKAS